MHTDSTSSTEQKLAARYIDKHGLNAALVAFFSDVLGEGITIDDKPLTAEQAALAATWIVGEQ